MVRDLPPAFQWFGLGQDIGRWLIVGRRWRVGFVAFAWALRHLPPGRAVYATGSDPEAARLAGIRPRRVVFGVFVLMGALTGLAALLNAVRFVDVDPNAGTGLELQVIAAVVVGGDGDLGRARHADRHAARRRAAGTIGPALVFLGTPGRSGRRRSRALIILLAVASDAFSRRRGLQERRA